MTRKTPPGRAAKLLPGALTLTLGACQPAAPSQRPDASTHAAEITRWRAAREAELRGEHGWLALAGLHWLSEGSHRLGSAPGADVALPDGAPAQVGILTVHGREVRLHSEPGIDVKLAGVAVTDTVLRSDADPAGPDRVTISGRFELRIIARGDRLGVRLYDPEAPARREFTGLTAFPLAPQWRVTARFEPYASPRQIEHPTVVGTTKAEVPGVAVFTVDGHELRLTPILETGPTGPELLFVFRDLTSDGETYPGGRFLVTPLPQGGALELDFNRAVNPPCAFTPYATCPLPLPENRLAVRIAAGEKTPAGQH